MKVAPPIQAERLYKLSIQQVWNLVTNQENLTKWLMPGNFEPVLGKQFHFQCVPPDADWDGKVTGEVLAVDAPNRVQFTWTNSMLKQATVVTFLLEEVPDGVRFSIEHTGFAADDMHQHEQHLAGWEKHLTLTEKLAQHERA